jgi:hypothetical protein
MKEIPLSGRRGVGKFALVDDEDYEQLIKQSWSLSRWGYAAGSRGKVHILMHRVIINAPVDMDVDHKNGDRLDNRKENLRLCTDSQNLRNARKSSNRSSNLKGVSKRRGLELFRTNVYVEGKGVHIGYFKDEHYAALAYDLWAVDIAGEFARTNFSVLRHWSSIVVE